VEYQDPEMHPPMSIDWCGLWDRYADEEVRRQYVENELQRILDAGLPPLYAVMTLPLASQRNVALAVLRALRPAISLRLAPTALPPPCDPYGRPLPPSKAGVAVLLYKTRGPAPGASEAAGQAWTGSARVAANRPNSRQPLYDVVEIGTTVPVALPVDDRLVALMNQWGYGVRPSRWRGKAVASRRDTWLLIEAPEGDQLLPPKKEPAPAPPRTRAA
jgi:hypothetical protein